jgi:LmbE family N-acetylglucosaminyl deacetylase
VITVFAGSPTEEISEFARTVHRKFNLTRDVGSIRRAEDIRALRVIEAEPFHGDLLDAIYRPDGTLGWEFTSNDDMFDTSRPLNHGVLMATCELLEPLLHMLAPETVFTCSAVGGHVDHRMVVAAVRRIWSPEQTVYWEDLPYACESPPLAAYRRENFFTEVANPLAWERKLEALLHYRSQFRILSTAKAKFPSNIWEHARHSHGVGGMSEAGWRDTPAV